MPTISRCFCLLMLGFWSLGCAPDDRRGGEATGRVAPAEDFPNRPVRFIVPFSAGGGTDLSARVLQRYLSAALDAPVVIENRPGGGGWVGWSELAASSADGYVIGYINLPNLIAGYANPYARRDETWEDFEFLTNHVVDAGVIAIRPHDPRFSDAASLIEYARHHPLSVNSSGVGSANHFVGLQMNSSLGTQLRFVHSPGTAQALPNVIGGHVDLLIAGIGETMAAIHNQDLVPVAVFGPARVAQLPEVPTLNEVTGTQTDKFLNRAIAAPKGLAPEVREKLQSALLRASRDERQIADMQRLGMQSDDLNGAPLLDLVKSQEQSVMALKPMFGW